MIYSCMKLWDSDRQGSAEEHELSSQISWETKTSENSIRIIYPKFTENARIINGVILMFKRDVVVKQNSKETQIFEAAGGGKFAILLLVCLAVL